jgi:hypothetical protein
MTPPSPVTSPPVAPPETVENLPGWSEIFYESFESGRSVIFTRGAFARITRTRAYDGRYSLEIRDDRGEASSFRTNPISVAGVSELEIDFWYHTILADAGEKFFLEWSAGGTTNWQVIRTFTMGTDFQNLQWKQVTHVWNVAGASNGYIRFRSGFSDSTEKLTIDKITLRGQ